MFQRELFGAGLGVGAACMLMSQPPECRQPALPRWHQLSPPGRVAYLQRRCLGIHKILEQVNIPSRLKSCRPASVGRSLLAPNRVAPIAEVAKRFVRGSQIGATRASYILG